MDIAAAQMETTAEMDTAAEMDDAVEMDAALQMETAAQKKTAAEKETAAEVETAAVKKSAAKKKIPANNEYTSLSLNSTPITNLHRGFDLRRLSKIFKAGESSPNSADKTLLAYGNVDTPSSPVEDQDGSVDVPDISDEDQDGNVDIPGSTDEDQDGNVDLPDESELSKGEGLITKSSPLGKKRARGTSVNKDKERKEEGDDEVSDRPRKAPKLAPQRKRRLRVSQTDDYPRI